MVVDRPLNACIEHQLVRLAEALVPEGEDDLDERLTQVAGLEAEYRRVVAPSLRTDSGHPAEQLFRRHASGRQDRGGHGRAGAVIRSAAQPAAPGH